MELTPVYHEMRGLFAMLLCYRHNLHMLHWKATGKRFDKIHSICDDYVSKFNTFIDEIAEIMLSIDINPLTMDEAIQVLNNNEKTFLLVESNHDYDYKEAFKAIDVMFTDLYTQYCIVSRAGEFSDISSKLDEHKYWLRIEGFYKNKKRLDD